MLDSHCHLDDPRYDPDRDDVWARARAAGVSRVLVPGVRPSQWAALRTMAQARGWSFAVGTHPGSLPGGDLRVPGDLSGAVAIGECGLDGPTPVAMETQEAVLAAHLALARDAGLPVILHGYRAHHRLLPLLRRWAPLRGVLHSYSGGPELVEDYLALGLHLSFAGALTWEHARKPVRALLRVPRERLLAETDGPDQCPRPHRGRSEPAYLVDIVAEMERLRGEPLVDALEANARALGW